MLDRIKKFLSPPVFEDEEQTRTAELLNIILLVLLGATVVGTLITIPLEPEEYVVNLTMGVLLVVSFLWLRGLARRGHLHLVGGLLAGVLWLVFTYLVWSNNGLRNPAITGYFLVTILAVLLSGRYAALISAGAGIVAAVGTLYGEQWGLIPTVVTRASSVLDLITLVTNLSLTAILLDFAMRSINQGFALARNSARAYAEANLELRLVRATLEQRVVERTRVLERRSEQLRAAAEIGRAAASIHDVPQLLTYLAGEIRRRFDLRYVGIYLLDEQGDMAVLRVVSPEAGEGDGRWLPSPGSRLAVGGQHPIGYVTRFGEARFLKQVGRRPTIYLPLIAGRRTLGAIEMQGEGEGSLMQSDIVVLQVLADLAATAIESARRLTEIQASLDAARLAYGEASRQAWMKVLQARAGIGYVCDYAGDVRPVRPTERVSRRPEARAALRDGRIVQADAATVFVPLTVRGQSLGVLRLRKPDEAGRWTVEDLNLLETMVEQLGMALESARLYQDTQRMATRERLVGEIAGKLRATLDPDAILKATVRELGRALGAAQAVVEITGPLSEGKED